MRHTPGPWEVHKHEHIDNEQWLSVLHGAWDITHNYASKPGVVADAKYSAMSDEENLANAYLIATALKCWRLWQFVNMALLVFAMRINTQKRGGVLTVLWNLLFVKQKEK